MKNPPVPDLKNLTSQEFLIWVDIKRLSASADWDRVEALIGEVSPGTLPYHDILCDALYNMVLGGRPGLIEKMCDLGFVAQKADVVRAIRAFSREPMTGPQHATYARALSALIHRTKSVDRQDVIAEILAAGDAEDFLPLLQSKGFDVLRDGFALAQVIEGLDVMGLVGLFRAGLSPFAPAVVRGIASLADDARPAASALHAEWFVIATDKNKTATVLLDALSRVQTGPYRAGVFLNPHFHDGSGAPITLLGVMAAQGIAADIFSDARRWVDHPQEARLVRDFLQSEYGVTDDGALQGLGDALAQKRLQGVRQRKPGLRL